MARLSVDISGLMALSRGAEETKRLKKQMYEEILKELAARLLRKVILRTPVGVKPTNVSQEVLDEHWKGYVGGTLRRGWTAKTEAEAESGGAPNISAFLAGTSIEDTGHGYCITIKNPCHYASYVEYGHRQTPGRFVPQLGKRLKASWVPGQFMLKISEDELRTQAPAIIQRKVEMFLLRHLLGVAVDMVNRIYSAIAKKLEELFDEPLIFFDQLPQTFKGPCFWVRLLKARQNQLLYNRYKVNLDFDIMMYPSNDEEFTGELNSVGTELNSVGTELLHGIEYIVTEDGNYLRGTNISYEVQDGVLHFFISYILFTVVPYDRGVKMNKLIQQYKYKG